MILSGSKCARLFSSPGPLSGAQWAGLRVGLLGGSFNPPHDGHFHISKIARQRFGLDAVWWLVSPGNPLKPTSDLGTIEQRLALVQEKASCPVFVPSDIEGKIGTFRTFDTIRRLKERFPRTQFFWICGMDNALIFHRWYRWREILREIPVVFVARPPFVTSVKSCPIKMLTHGKSGVFWVLDVPGVDLSSTQLRQGKEDGNR